MGCANGNINMDFCEQNPQLCLVEEFRAIYETYDKKIASKICWSVFMLVETDATVNKLALNSYKDRLQLIIDSYYNEFDEKEFKPIIKAYKKFCLSLEERLYEIQIKKFDELTDIIESLNLSKGEDYDKYIKTMKNYGSISKALDERRKIMEKAKEKTSSIYGDVQLSKAEQRRNKFKK